MPFLQEHVNSCVSASQSGLDDEDMLGEYRPIHLAAYKGSTESIEALVDVMKCNVNAKAFDGSNALFCAIAENGFPETVKCLITRGCNVNNQIFSGPGWQSNMTQFAGFTPLILAVNQGESLIVPILLEAGANTEAYTGPIPLKFPVSGGFMDVHEYGQDGHCFNALHIACIMDNDSIASDLLNLGKKAQVDARVKAADRCALVEGGGSFSATRHPLDDMHFLKEVQHALNTALHLATENSETAELLIKSGASLLSQNLQLDAAGLRHPEVLSNWLSDETETNSILSVCSSKNVPIQCAHLVIEYCISLHLRDHFERAIKQELDPSNWPWIALGLTHKLQLNSIDESLASYWAVYGEDILKDLQLTSQHGRRVHNIPVVVTTFVSTELRKSKQEQCHRLQNLINALISDIEYDEVDVVPTDDSDSVDA